MIGLLASVYLAGALAQHSPDATPLLDERRSQAQRQGFIPSDDQRAIEQAIIRRLDDIERSVLFVNDSEARGSAVEVLASLLETLSPDYPLLRQLLARQARDLARFHEIPCSDIPEDRLPADYIALVQRLTNPDIQCLYKSLAINTLLKRPEVQKVVVERDLLAQLQRLRQSHRAPLESASSTLEKIQALFVDLPASYGAMGTFLARKAMRLKPYHTVPCRAIKASQVPSDFLVKLRQLDDPAVECELKRALRKIHYEEALARRQEQLIREATQLALFAANPVTIIQWDGGTCGCAPTTARTVYGFYPFWQSSPEPQHVDFSTLSRIGYFALTFDEKGQITDPRHWRKKRPFSRFIDLAHKYRAKMDLVVYNHIWDSWGEFTPGETAVVANRLTSNIVERVNVPLTNYLINTMKPIISFGFSPIRTMGDGVTLYFDFESARDKDPDLIFANLYLLVDQLRTKLDQTGRSFELNVMFPFSAMVDAESVYRVANLQKLMDQVDFFLVVLDDPGEAVMKDLRYEIEQQVSSKEQRALVRKLLPVISPIDDPRRFEEQLTYFDDNFGGAGLWPIPIGDDARLNSLRTIIRDELLNSAESAICRIVCPNRWMSRIVLFGVLLSTVSLGLLSLWIAEVRRVVGAYSRYGPVIALLAMVFLGLTVWCDPYWNSHQLELVFVSLVAGTSAIIWVSLRKRREGEYP